MKNRFKNHGFEFTYSKRHIGTSEYFPIEAMETLPDTKHNEDEYPLYVRCGTCGAYMDFSKGTKGIQSGKWTCRTCGITVRESTAYRQLDRENFAFLKEIGMEDDYS